MAGLVSWCISEVTDFDDTNLQFALNEFHFDELKEIAVDCTRVIESTMSCDWAFLANGEANSTVTNVYKMYMYILQMYIKHL